MLACVESGQAGLRFEPVDIGAVASEASERRGRRGEGIAPEIRREACRTILAGTGESSYPPRGLPAGNLRSSRR